MGYRVRAAQPVGITDVRAGRISGGGAPCAAACRRATARDDHRSPPAPGRPGRPQPARRSSTARRRRLPRAPRRRTRPGAGAPRSRRVADDLRPGNHLVHRLSSRNAAAPRNRTARRTTPGRLTPRAPHRHTPRAGNRHTPRAPHRHTRRAGIRHSPRAPHRHTGRAGYRTDQHGVAHPAPCARLAGRGPLDPAAQPPPVPGGRRYADGRFLASAVHPARGSQHGGRLAGHHPAGDRPGHRLVGPSGRGRRRRRSAAPDVPGRGDARAGGSRARAPPRPARARAPGNRPGGAGPAARRATPGGRRTARVGDGADRVTSHRPRHVRRDRHRSRRAQRRRSPYGR
jgi:hypothetical protein